MLQKPPVVKQFNFLLINFFLHIYKILGNHYATTNEYFVPLALTILYILLVSCRCGLGDVERCGVDVAVAHNIWNNLLQWKLLIRIDLDRL